MARQWTFTRVPDSTVIKLFRHMQKLDASMRPSFSLADNVDTSLDDDGKLPSEYDKLLGSDTYLIRSAHAQNNYDVKLTYHRAQTYMIAANGRPAWIPGPNPFIDGLEFNSGSAPAAVLMPALHTISTMVKSAPPVAGLSAAEDELAHSSSVLNRISEAAANLIDHTGQRLAELDEYRRSLEQDAEARLARDQERVAEEYAAKVAALDAREADFAAREALAESGTNTDVRRRLQKAMATLSENTLAGGLLNRSETAFRTPAVFALLIIAVVALVAGIEISQLRQLSQALSQAITTPTILAKDKAAVIANLNQEIFYAQIRFAATTIGAGLLVWFTLRFAVTRYRQISRWEHDLHRFRLDTERASFLIEGELEARRLDGQVLPQVVLDRFSRGLFTSDGSDAGGSSDSVGMMFASLVNRAANLKITPGGTEIDISQGGIKRANKDVASAGGEA